jgi:hypothetical protein
MQVASERQIRAGGEADGLPGVKVGERMHYIEEHK